MKTQQTKTQIAECSADGDRCFHCSCDKCQQWAGTERSMMKLDADIRRMARKITPGNIVEIADLYNISAAAQDLSTKQLTAFMDLRAAFGWFDKVTNEHTGRAKYVATGWFVSAIRGN